MALYRIAPPPAWFWFGDNSELLADGTIEAFDSNDMVTPKPFSLDAAGTVLVTEEEFDSQGRLPPIYWSNEGSYYIVLRDKFGAEVLTINNFPPPYVGLTPQDIEAPYLDNHVINGQFYFPYTVSNPIADGVRTPIADGGWFFETDNSTNADSVNFDAFIDGQTEVEANPPFSLRVSSTSADTAETYKRSGQKLGDVSSFSGQQITVSGQFKSSTNSTIEITLEQYFGTGGSPSTPVDVPVAEVEAGTSWQKVTFTINVPTIEGKTRGSDGNDALIIFTNYPLADTFTVSSTNYSLLNGEITAPYPYQTKDEVGIDTKAKSLPRQSNTGSDIGKSLKINAANEQVWFDEVPLITQDGSQQGYILTVNNLNKSQWLPNSPVLSGSIFMWPGITAPAGYLLMQGQEISRTTYSTLLGIFTFQQSGTLTNGVNTVSGLTDTSNMFIGMEVEGSNIPAATTIASIVDANNITLSANATASGSTAITFFIWGSGNGSTTFNLPDWRGRSPLGAGEGSGLTERIIGQTGGEENHELTEDENATHSHGANDFFQTGTGFPFDPLGAGVFAVSGIPDSGLGDGHNTMHPYAVINWIIKT